MSTSDQEGITSWGLTDFEREVVAIFVNLWRQEEENRPCFVHPAFVARHCGGPLEDVGQLSGRVRLVRLVVDGLFGDTDGYTTSGRFFLPTIIELINERFDISPPCGESDERDRELRRLLDDDDE